MHSRHAFIGLIMVFTFVTGCSAVRLAQVTPPEGIADQPVALLETSGNFWGLGRSGTFTLGTNHSGSFNRSASSSSFMSFGSASTAMVSTIRNARTGSSYEIVCEGSENGLSFGNLSLGTEKPFSCNIGRDGEKVGTFTLEKDSGLVGPSGKVKGGIRVGNVRYSIFSVHESDDALVPVEQPLGYLVTGKGRDAAVIQVNGGISLQHRRTSDQRGDILAIATIAAGLRIPIDN